METYQKTGRTPEITHSLWCKISTVVPRLGNNQRTYLKIEQMREGYAGIGVTTFRSIKSIVDTALPKINSPEDLVGLVQNPNPFEFEDAVVQDLLAVGEWSNTVHYVICTALRRLAQLNQKEILRVLCEENRGFAGMAYYSDGGAQLNPVRIQDVVSELLR